MIGGKKINKVREFFTAITNERSVNSTESNIVMFTYAL